MNPQLRFDEIDSLPHNKTVAVANNFIIQTTQFLNRFSFLCEEKLALVSRNIQRLEITMSILEAKLNSIPDDGLQSSSAAAPASSTDVVAEEGGSVDVPLVEEEEFDAPGGREDDYYEDAFAEPDAPEEGGLKLKDDPRYATYFKMLKLRVPAASIKQKMMMEGIDPNILDTPDAPSDAPMGAAGSAGELREMSEDSSEELEFSE